MDPLAVRLKKEKLGDAAKAFVFHNQIRNLPPHSRETLLVNGVRKRSTVSRWLGTPEWSVPDTFQGRLPNTRGEPTGTFGASSEGLGVLDQGFSTVHSNSDVTLAARLGAS